MQSSPFHVVGVGASAGGLDAFHRFFQRMPADSGMAFVVILHLPADRKSMLPDILRRWTPMRVSEAQDGMLIEPNCVYVPPPHALVTIQDGRLGVQVPVTDDTKIPRPIDSFFDALGSALGEHAIGIVLSGTGSDGALGLKAIKECGGFTIAQGTDGSAPQYAEMPAGAIATGAVDLAAPIEDLAGHLLRLKGSAPAVLEPTDDSEDAADAARLKICSILRAQLGHDFSGYRDQTFLRRVQRRMQVVDARTLNDYIARLQADHGEALLLFRDLLIRVTSFFRDQETFAALEPEAIPSLFAGKRADGAVRVWVPGCATGEEAYSIAILLREYMDKLEALPKVQLFATDIDEAAISTARLGRYPETLLKGLSAERRERFFRASHGGYVVSKEIRELCTFSAHNLVRDPPFSRMDMVSCRNLLIYMETDLQATVIPAFHYSLLPGGILLLGGSESLARYAKLFEPLDKTARIFKRRAGRSPPLNLSVRHRDIDVQRSVLEAARLPSVDREIQTSPASEATASAPLRAASNEVRPDAPPLNGNHNNGPPPGGNALSHAAIPDENAELKQALIATQEQLQSLTEQHQTALEELRSSNEELHSVNEELQSTNEEIETSKEELQSVNEELHTVNVQLADKVEELGNTNSDLRNLFESTQIATIFLDRHLIIRNFTPAVTALYSLIPSDAGRPLSNIVSNLDYDTLTEDVAEVLRTLTPLERRIARKDRATHFIMRILPYREPDSTVSGVLVTFVDVTSIVQAEEALREADLRKDVFLATLSHELRNPLAPIRSASRLLAVPGIAPEQLGRAQTIISRQVAHMSSLLDDLLDVSRITRGAFALKKDRIEVKKLLEAAVESAQSAMDAKRHTLRVEIPEIPVVLYADQVRITQILTNLLTNAAKYTPAGGIISMGARVSADELILFVRDSGIGLSAAMIPRIFDMFTQVESTAEASEGGLGIGLALVKGLVQLHGGRVSANSGGLGQGSEFVVSLPRSLIIEAASAPVEGNSASSHGAPRRVLVADDNSDGAETLAMILKLSGHEVHLAHSGAEALSSAQELQPEVAILDIGMPDISGYEVARRIRNEVWGSKMILIALTGWGQENDKRRAKMAGFDYHCTKPVDPETLERFFYDADAASEAADK